MDIQPRLRQCFQELAKSIKLTLKSTDSFGSMIQEEFGPSFVDRRIATYGIAD